VGVAVIGMATAYAESTLASSFINARPKWSNLAWRSGDFISVKGLKAPWVAQFFLARLF